MTRDNLARSAVDGGMRTCRPPINLSARQRPACLACLVVIGALALGLLTEDQGVTTTVQPQAESLAQAKGTQVPSEDTMRDILDSVIAMYNFEERTVSKGRGQNSPTVINDVGPGQMHGQLAGLYKFDEGIAGQAIFVNGEYSAVQIPSMEPLFVNREKEVTLSLWHRTDRAKLGILFDCGGHAYGGVSLVSLPDGRYRVNYQGQNYDSTLEYEANQWRHVAIVIEPAWLSMFINGRRVEDWQMRSFKSPARVERIGIIGGQSKPQQRAARYFDGLIDEFVVLRNALQDEQIKQLYEWSKSGEILPTVADKDPGTSP